MHKWLQQRSIGQQILLLVLVLVIPASALFAWFLAADLKVLASLPYAQLYAEHQRLERTGLLLGLPTLLITLLLGWYIARNIIKPVNALSQSAATIAAGNTTVRAQTLGPPEIATIATQLNRIMDIHDQNESALRSSETFSISILNSIRSAIAVLNHEGIIIMVNEAWLAFAETNAAPITLTKASGWIGVNYLAACEPAPSAAENDEGRQIHRGILSVLAGELNHFDMEYPCDAPDQARWFHINVTPLAPRQRGVVIAHTEISERKLAELKLQQNQALLHNIINGTQSQIFALDLQSRYILLNDALANFLGQSKQALVGKTVNDLFEPEMATPLAQTNQRVMETGQRLKLDEAIVSKNGELSRHVMTSLFPLMDGHGKVIGMAGVATDITALKLAERALREREKQNQALINAIPDLIFINRRDGEFMACHTSHKALFLGPPEAIVNQKISAVMPAAIAPLFLQGIANAIDHQTLQELNFALPINGQEYWYEARIVPCTDNTALSIVRDVTDHRQAELGLQASLLEKQVLLNEIHHRVKNNLQIIASLLRLESGRSHLEETRTVLAEMQGRIQAMAVLHESIYRHGASSAVGLHDYLHQLATQTFSILQDKVNSIALQLDLQASQVNLDQATPCGLLLNELLTNCISHAFPAGKSGWVRVELFEQGTQLILRVSDNGIGLPADFSERCSRSLGLQLVSSLARQLQGTLEHSSSPHTMFTVTFPLQMLKRKPGKTV